MSILDRLNLLIRSNINDTSSSGRSAFRSTMRDMESSLRDARRQLAELRVNERKLVENIRQERQQVDRWEDRAIMALQNGDDDLARSAIVEKNKIQREVDRLHEQLDDHRAYMRDIESSLEALEVKLEGTRGRMDVERRERGYSRDASSNSGGVQSERDWDAEMRRRMRDRDGGSSSERSRDSYREDRSREDRYRDDRGYRDGGYRGEDGDSTRARGPGFDTFDTEPTFREFDRMSHRISTMEAEIDAIRELGDDDLMDPRKRELEDIFSKMERKKKVDDGLSDLKAKFSDD
jgi:phage shock protein A